MTKEKDSDPKDPVKVENHQNVPVEAPDRENIQVPTNRQQPIMKTPRGKRPQFIRRPGLRKRSYSYSEGHSSGKRFKRGPKTPVNTGTKFLFGGNIRDPLNLNALSHDDQEKRKSGDANVLQPKKFEGHAGKLNTSSTAGGGTGGGGRGGKQHWKKNNSGSFQQHEAKTKFLLGGNVRDPLNLNSFSDEKIARIANAVTPQSSPMPTPKHRKPEYKIEVLIPPNISDPLNLMNDDDNSTLDSSDFVSPETLRRRRHQQQQQKSSNTVKFENASDNSGGGKNVRFRKRAKSMICGGSASAQGDSALFAARATIANKRREPKEDDNVFANDEKKKGSDIEKVETEKTDPKKSSGEVDSSPTAEPEVEKKKPTTAKDKESKAGTSKAATTSASSKPPKTGSGGKFEYGNYDRYYGYRHPGTSNVYPGAFEDDRLLHFRPEWFFAKDVLDIGCNVGKVTLEIARRFAPKSLLGIDIDPSLIRVAKKFASNMKEYQVPPSTQPTPIASLSAAATPSRSQPEASGDHCEPSTSTATTTTPSTTTTKSPSKNCESLFPQSLPMLFGPLDPTGAASGRGSGGGRNSAAATPHPYQTPRTAVNATAGPVSLFGRNIRFFCDNYVPESDDAIDAAQPEYDTILCLSTTKWMHLNFGDDGIKRAFKRMFAQLRPGGILILEAQGFSSYGKKKKLTPRIFENYKAIKLRPDHFKDYLLNEVGFSTSQMIAVPRHESRGFQRPIQVYTKMPIMSTRSLGETTNSSQNTPYYCATCGAGGGSSWPATPHSSHTTPYHSCSGSCQATPLYYHHYTSEGETPVHSSMQ